MKSERQYKAHILRDVQLVRFPRDSIILASFVTVPRAGKIRRCHYLGRFYPERSFRDYIHAEEVIKLGDLSWITFISNYNVGVKCNENPFPQRFSSPPPPNRDDVRTLGKPNLTDVPLNMQDLWAHINMHKSTYLRITSWGERTGIKVQLMEPGLRFRVTHSRSN